VVLEAYRKDMYVNKQRKTNEEQVLTELQLKKNVLYVDAFFNATTKHWTMVGHVTEEFHHIIIQE